MRELAERSGLPEDVIEAIENGRRRRGVTVDELMVLANALNTMAPLLLPRDYDYMPEEMKRRIDEDQQRRSEQPSEIRAGLEAMVKVQKAMPILLEYAEKMAHRLESLGELDSIGGLGELEKRLEEAGLAPVE